MNAPNPMTRAEATRARILDAAAALFWRRSFHGVAIDEIAARSEVNKATIYRYFLDKSELALAAIAHNGDAVIDSVFAASFSRFDCPEQRLVHIYRYLYQAHLDFADEEGDLYGCPIAGLALELGQDMPDLRLEAQRIFDRVENFMRSIARDRIASGHVMSLDERGLATGLVQILHGAFTSARLAVDAEKIVAACNASLALIGSAQVVESETMRVCS